MSAEQSAEVQGITLPPPWGISSTCGDGTTQKRTCMQPPVERDGMAGSLHDGVTGDTSSAVSLPAGASRDAQRVVTRRTCALVRQRTRCGPLQRGEEKL